ncbi:Beige/BEACH domain containing protein [Tritrichomonas foetus]|uniref:Beige/BEACH domain containing protein n=1 Tax=Tritrichomonas foetus TaxID=1144522 RepID=A0A1J4K4N5_9EUKA|nr:Beige/BEACH domain containing protein [Tritrichomonas foetus]|eukprot:OHT04461.1 Beige/BEACH domain containing protein [Tritrichomonas foetus]
MPLKFFFMTHFEPVFFSPVKPPDNDYVTNNCVTAFSIQINSPFPVLRHEVGLVDTLLKEHTNFHKMELLSVLYDFLYVMRVPLSNDPNDQSVNVFILATRKLYTIGYFANQMFRQNDTDFVSYIPFLFETLMKLYNRYQDLGQYATCAVGYVLSSISYRYKDFKVNSPNSSIYFKIADLAVKFCRVPSTMPNEILRLFHTFFLFTLFSFPSDCEIPIEYQNLLQSIVAMVTSALATAIEPNFNFIGLSTHLISFLNSKYYDMAVRYRMFNLIHLIAHHYQIAADFIFDATNLQIFAQFIADVINDEEIEFPIDAIPKPIPADVQPESNQLLVYRMIDVSTFSSPVPILSDDKRKFNYNIHEPSIYNQFPLTQRMRTVLETTESLCSSASFQSVPLTNTQLIKALINVYGNSIPAKVILFIIHWIKYILNLNSNLSLGVKVLNENGIFELLLNYSFTKFRYSELIKFTCEFFPYILNRNPEDCTFLNPLFQYFEECIFLSTLESSIYNLVCLCIVVSPSRVVKVLTSMFYDERIANLLLFLRLQHITAIKEGSSFSKQIEQNRLSIFTYIDILLSFDEYDTFLFESSKFMESLMQMIFEEKIQNYVIGQLGNAISRLNASHSSLESIFIFFQGIYSSDDSMLPLKTKILELISTKLPNNTIEIAKAFLRTGFFDTLIAFVQSTNDQANVYKLLELFRIFSVIRGDMRKYIAEADLFSKLHVLIEPFFKEQIDLLLMGNLWSIVFEDQKGDSSIREIKNATPLPLIFHLLEKNESEFLKFIRFMVDCCERDISSTLEVNSSDFPSHLIQFLFQYRQLHQTDQKFEQVFTLFTMLSLYSIKGKDLLSLLQLMSALPGNFRPVFSMDIMRGFLSLFQSPYDAPPSFIHIAQSDHKLCDFPISESVNLSEFSFLIDIEFSDSGKVPADLFFIETRNNSKYFNSFRLSYFNNKISYDIRSENKMIHGEFDYQFVAKTWSQIVIQYAKRKLQLYVHGKEHAKIELPVSFILKNEITDSYVAKGLLCNIGFFFLSKIALDPSIIRLLSTFPRSFICSFSNSEKSEFPSEYRQLFELNKQSLCMFNPAVSYDGNIINLSHFGPMYTCAQIFGYSPQAKDVMHVVGGVQAILPIFEQLDMPILPDEGQSVSYIFDPTFLPFLLQILYSMLQQSRENQEEFYHVNGFGILGFLLTRVTMQHFSIQAVELFRKILYMIEYWPLAEQMIDQIFLNARIWIYFPKEIQMMVYQTVHLFYENLDNPKKKKKFAQFLPYSKVLHLMRVYFWSAETDKQICLLNGPKVDPITREETFRRIQDMQEIRGVLWNISRDVLPEFSKSDAVTLCTLCFDLKDVSLTVDTLTSLLLLIFDQNKILLEVLKADYTFNSFFTLLVSPNERIRAQCIHIFVRFLNLPEQDRLKLLNPFTPNEWMTGIISTIQMAGTSQIFADVVFGYLFGLYPQKRFYPVPRERISQDTSTNPYKFVMPEFLPLAMLSIADFEESIAVKYIAAISRSAVVNGESILAMKDWDHPFIMFLIHRMPNSQCQPDQASHVCLQVLTHLYSRSKQLSQLQMYIALFSARTMLDFSHISRIVFLQFINTILVQQHTSLPHQTIYDFYRIVFEFIFLVPNSDPYFLPEFEHSSDNIPKDDRVTFKDLHQIKYHGDTPTISYTYSTRTKSDGTWVDEALADRFLLVLSNTPFLFSIRPSITTKEKQLHPLFMYSFTLGAGLQHPQYYSKFIKHIKPLVSLLPKGKMESVYFECFIHLMAGIIRCCQATEFTHQSHVLLFELSQDFSSTINVHFEMKSNRGMTMSHFKSQVFTTHGFCNLIMQKQALSEETLSQFAKRQTKNQARIITALATSNSHYAEKLSELNVFQSSSDLSLRNDQLHYRLLEFASQLRNGHFRSLKQYRALWRTLSSEGGPWHRPESNLQHHYKLDYSIHKFYTRGRLKENFSYTDHKDASLLRDEGKSEEAAQKYNEHLKKLRISEFNGNESIVQMGASDNVEDSEAVENQHGRDDDVTLSAPAKLVTMKRLYSGNLMLTKQFLIFEGDSKYKRIPLSSIKQVFHRRYLLLDTSMEIFTVNNHSYFFDFISGQRDKIIQQLRNSYMPNLQFLQTCANDLQKEIKKCTNDWVNGKISNFTYLMNLNILAGRTYNDLSQYPVFPWVIADYTSEELDLTNPKTFRDLSIPIGALDKDRFDYLKEKMGPEPETHYLYGSFYSSSAVVIGYLIRMEPFTSLHIELQSGKFDFSDRLFQSIPGAWSSINKNAMDFRELIPEFFYFPDFLMNSNDFDLGRMEFNNNDVELPPWAKSAPDFIRKNRAALESDYVSLHLPEWIDLTFGINSRGAGAEKVNNLFSPFFFDSAITKEVLNDPARLSFVQEYSACFGQAPSLIFNEPHCSKKASVLQLDKPKLALLYNASEIVVHASEADKNGSFNIVTASYELHRTRVGKSRLACNTSVKPADIHKLPNLIKSNDKYIAYAFPWDTAFYIDSFSGKSTLKRTHTRAVTAVAISKNFVAAGSEDCTCVVWKLENCQQHSILSKHHASITCIAINEEADLVVSGSKDGVIVISTLLEGKYIRNCTCNGIGEPKEIQISPLGNFVVNFTLGDKDFIRLYDQNLNLLGEKVVYGITSWCFIEMNDGRAYLLLLLHNKYLRLESLPEFKMQWEDKEFKKNVNVMKLVRNPLSVIIGTKHGEVYQLSF